MLNILHYQMLTVFLFSVQNIKTNTTKPPKTTRGIRTTLLLIITKIQKMNGAALRNLQVEVVTVGITPHQRRKKVSAEEEITDTVAGEFMGNFF